ncbi:AMP binding protein [Mycena kentingensis (nom. inval.)]|nr:AMP binding protein [Mycena kentingensis (nom. inval.)]
MTQTVRPIAEQVAGGSGLPLASLQMPTIYKSPVPDGRVLSTSIFSFLFTSSPDSRLIGGFPASLPAFVDGATATSISRGQLHKLALSFAYGLKNHPTISAYAKRGDTVLIYSPNSIAWPVVLFGAVAAGLRCTLANSAYTPHELAYQYIDSCAQILLTFEDGLSTVRAMFKECAIPETEANKRIIVLGRDLRWAGGPAAPVPKGSEGLLRMENFFGMGSLPINGEDKFEGSLAHETVYLCYSSGTTGRPKGVETTHQNMTTVLDIVIATFPPLISNQDVMLGILPCYHIYGTAKLLHFPFLRGVPVVFQQRFDPDQFCAAVQKYKITACLVAPPVLVVLAKHPAVDQYDLSTLTLLFSGAAPLGFDLVKSVKKRLLGKRGGRPDLCVTQGYGLTETSPTTHILPVEHADRKVGSIGILIPNLEARLVEDEDGLVDAKEGQPGELWIRGPTVMKGYLNNPTATANAITPDKWFKTGDIAIRDPEGFYTIVDRRKELIKYKGFQVPPAELESILLSHPDIADAAVIGLYSEKEATELPRAYVVHTHPKRIASPKAKADFAQGVVKWMEAKVAQHKRLRGGVAIIDAVPKSAAGKILRRELREQAKKEAERGELGGEVKAKL